jgi:hypothetical protein
MRSGVRSHVQAQELPIWAFSFFPYGGNLLGHRIARQPETRKVTNVQLGAIMNILLLGCALGPPALFRIISPFLRW